jgi:hypothetical protein
MTEEKLECPVHGLVTRNTWKDKYGGLWNTHEVNGHHCHTQIQPGDSVYENKYNELHERHGELEDRILWCKSRLAVVRETLINFGERMDPGEDADLVYGLQAIVEDSIEKLDY